MINNTTLSPFRLTAPAEKIFIILYDEYGDKKLLERLSDPLWFQALGCTLGFDWHSSGITTTTTAAIKEALQKINMGVYGAGGKGKTSKKTLQEIEDKGNEINLSDKKLKFFIKLSKLAAKVDSAALQDSFQLYHHTFFFSKNDWVVIQQGMLTKGDYARRYHWDNTENFLNEPHKAICCDKVVKPLNMVAREAEETRKISVDIAKDYKDYFYAVKEKKQGQTSLLDFPSSIIRFKKTAKISNKA